MPNDEPRGTVDGRIVVLAPTLTVVLKDGRRYAANHITATFLEAGFREPALVFVCSGKLETFAAREIKGIEYGRVGHHCDDCGQRFPDNLRPQPGEETIELRFATDVAAPYRV